MPNLIDLTDRVFGRLMVLHKDESKSKSCAYWICECECGNITSVSSQSLRSEITQSCGCYRKDRATKHGGFGTLLYNVWNAMKQRIDNPNNQRYKNYGGRGIIYCTSWKNYENFKQWAVTNGYEDTLTLDRIDVNGNYEPSNCRWISNFEQQSNRTNNRFVIINNESITITEAGRKYGVSRSKFYHDTLEHGMSDEEAINNQLGEEIVKYAV